MHESLSEQQTDKESRKKQHKLFLPTSSKKNSNADTSLSHLVWTLGSHLLNGSTSDTKAQFKPFDAIIADFICIILLYPFHTWGTFWNITVILEFDAKASQNEIMKYEKNSRKCHTHGVFWESLCAVEPLGLCYLQGVGFRELYSAQSSVVVGLEARLFGASCAPTCPSFPSAKIGRALGGSCEVSHGWSLCCEMELLTFYRACLSS